MIFKESCSNLVLLDRGFQGKELHRIRLEYSNPLINITCHMK